MKKNTIALLLSVVLAAGSIGAVPVWAAEPMTEASAEITEEDAEPTDEAAADAVTGMAAEIAAEEEPEEEAVVEEPASGEAATEVLASGEAVGSADAAEAADAEEAAEAAEAADAEEAAEATESTDETEPQDLIIEEAEQMEHSTEAVYESEGSSGEFGGSTYTIFWDDWGGSGYKFSEASLKCELAGGHLVTINSQEEEAFVRGLLANDPMMKKIMSYHTGMYSGCWIGALRNSTGEAWRWINGEPFNYPAASSLRSDALRISYLGEKNTINQGGDPTLATSMGYICEWEAEKDLEKAEVELGSLLTDGEGNLSHAYTGSPIKPAVKGVKLNKKALTEGTDYKVQYGENRDFGEGTVTISGLGSYTGSVTKTFSIVLGKTGRGDMFNLANNVKVTWKAVPGAKYYKVYRSGLKTPVIVTSGLVGWDKEPGLQNGKKYTYKIVASLTGSGDPSGDSPLSYSKVMYRLQTVVIRSVKNTAPGKVTVKYDRTASGDSYVLQYCEREDMVGAKTKVVLGAANTSYVIGGLKKGKTYYISIRVRKKVNGIDYYTTFGVAKKVKVTQ